MNKHVKRLLVFLCVVVSAAFALVLIGSIVITLDPPPSATNCAGALAGGCIVALAIVLHGVITRRPPKE